MVEKLFEGSNVLVTGISGFVGGIAARDLLAQGAGVIGVMRDPDKACLLNQAGMAQHVAVHRGDLKSVEDLRAVFASHHIDAVLHLAGEAILGKDQSQGAYNSNAAITLNLLETLQDDAPETALLLASSDMVYGPGSGRPFEEDMPPRPHNPYARSKLESEQLLQRFAEQHPAPVGIVRLSNVYGGGDFNFSRLIPGIASTIASGHQPSMRSDGQSVRDFVHVDDVVRGMLIFLSRLMAGEMRGQICNLAAGRSVRVIEVVIQLLAAAGRQDLYPRLGEPDEGGDRERWVSVQKAERLLGWTPEVDLGEGLAETMDWYQTASPGGTQER